MGFWDKIVKGLLFTKKEEHVQKMSDTVSSVTAPVTPPTAVAELEMDGYNYILDTFDLDFKKHPDSDYMYSGIITLSTHEPLHTSIGRWVMLDTLHKDGIVRFYANETSLSSGALFEISFSEAVCMRYGKNAEGKDETTHLVIVPRYLRMRQEDIVNFN